MLQKSAKLSKSSSNLSVPLPIICQRRISQPFGVGQRDEEEKKIVIFTGRSCVAIVTVNMIFHPLRSGVNRANQMHIIRSIVGRSEWG